MILEKTIKKASLLLKNHNIASYELDAEIILSDLMGVTKEFLIANTPTIRSEIPTRNSAILENLFNGVISLIKIARKANKRTPEECPKPHEKLFLRAFWGLLIAAGAIAIR